MSRRFELHFPWVSASLIYMATNADITYSRQDRGDILVTAFEGGSNYWTRVTQVSRTPDEAGTDLYPLTIVRIWFTEDDPAVADVEHCLSVEMDALDRAAERIVNEGLAGDWIVRAIRSGDIGNIDADVADCIVQVATLGRITYG